MNLTRTHYPLSVQLIADLHVILSEMPAKVSRKVLNALEAELIIQEKSAVQTVDVKDDGQVQEK